MQILDGLLDEKARFHVEFIKDPCDIDEAVYHTVCFQETKQRTRKSVQHNTRSINATVNYENNSDTDEGIIAARTAPGKNRDKIITKRRSAYN